MSKIRITNPKPGCANYTSERQAERYVRRGEAIRIGQELRFLTDNEQRHMRNVERSITQSQRESSDVYVDRLGTIWWDGGDPGGMHRPGERVS